PLGDDSCHILLVHFFLQHARGAALLGRRAELCQLRFGLPEFAVTDGRHTLQFAAPLRLLLFNLELLDALLELANRGMASFSSFQRSLRAEDCSRICESSRSTALSRSREFGSSSFLS